MASSNNPLKVSAALGFAKLSQQTPVFYDEPKAKSYALVVYRESDKLDDSFPRNPKAAPERIEVRPAEFRDPSLDNTLLHMLVKTPNCPVARTLQSFRSILSIEVFPKATPRMHHQRIDVTEMGCGSSHEIQSLLKITFGLRWSSGDKACNNEHMRLFCTDDSRSQGIRPCRLVERGKYACTPALNSYKGKVKAGPLHKIESGLGQLMQGAGKSKPKPERVLHQHFTQFMYSRAIGSKIVVEKDHNLEALGRDLLKFREDVFSAPRSEASLAELDHRAEGAVKRTTP